jgi:hypothetical protein
MTKRNPGLCVLAALALIGCAEPAEETETASQGLTKDIEVKVAEGLNRIVRRTCGRTCAKWTPRKPPKPGLPPVSTCIKWVDSCTAGVPPVGAKVYANAASAASDTPFQAFNEGPSWQYRGCGPQAAQNIVAYYGGQVPIATANSFMSTFDVPFSDSIATSPDDLTNGLKALLRVYTDGIFDVQRFSDVVPIRDAVLNELLGGHPVIMLVQGGDHYIVATGVDLLKRQYYIIDYPNKAGRWIGEDALETELHFPASWASFFPGGSGGYEDNTMIVIRRTGTKPLDTTAMPNMWRAAQPSAVSSENYAAFAVTTAEAGIPEIAYATVPLDGSKIQWKLASTTSDPPGNLTVLSGPAMVYLSHADGTPGDLQIFVTGANNNILEKHQTKGIWRTWGHVAPLLPPVGGKQPRIGSAPAAVAPRNAALAVYKDPVVAITDDLGNVWAIPTSLDGDNVKWGSWSQLPSKTAGGATLKFTSAPSLWADSFGRVRAVAVADDTRAYESARDNGAWQPWNELPGNGFFRSAVSASFFTDFESQHAVDYAGLGGDLAPWHATRDLLGGGFDGWHRDMKLDIADSSVGVGNDYDFDRGFRRFLLIRGVDGGQSQWYWRLLTDDDSIGWRTMRR